MSTRPLCDVVVHNATKNRAFGVRFFVGAVEMVIAHASPSMKSVEVGINIVGPRAMQALNRTHRHIDKPTDVLSFPLHTKPIAGYTAIGLGDLIICPDVVQKKANELGHTLRYQMAWTVVHGVLHLLGYDHERSEKEARAMEAQEHKILLQLTNG
jgi:probable rRNA maturation factor